MPLKSSGDLAITSYKVRSSFELRRDSFRRNAFAPKHIDEVAVGGKFIYKGSCQVLVFQKGCPLRKSEVGGDDC